MFFFKKMRFFAMNICNVPNITNSNYHIWSYEHINWISCTQRCEIRVIFDNNSHCLFCRTEPLDYSTFTSVKDWLEAIKMGMYASNFTKAGYKELTDVASLTEDELLKKVGVRLIGHRHKIYMRIKEMSDEMKLKREQSVRIWCFGELYDGYSRKMEQSATWSRLQIGYFSC